MRGYERISMKTVILLLVALGGMSYALPNQEAGPSAWERAEKNDPLHKLDYTQFTLEGKYLIPPKHSSTPPLLVLRCKEGAHNYERGMVLNGKLLAGYLAVDAVLDFKQGKVPIEFRLDDGKLQQIDWSSSTDGSGAFFSGADLDNLLYGHLLPHKENTNPPVRKVIMGVPEYLGAEIEAEFDMPEPGAVAEVCGVIAHKKS